MKTKSTRYSALLGLLLLFTSTCTNSETCDEGQIELRVPCAFDGTDRIRLFYTIQGAGEQELEAVEARCPETPIRITAKSYSKTSESQPITFRVELIGRDGEPLGTLTAAAQPGPQCSVEVAVVSENRADAGTDLKDAGSSNDVSDGGTTTDDKDGSSTDADTVQQPDGGGPVISCASPLQACGDQCVDKKSDKNNCGSCGNRCDYPNAAGSCEGGACKQGACNESFADCSQASGCETPLATKTNCLSCGDACSVCASDGCSGIGWISQSGSAGDEVASATAVDSQGNVFVTGSTTGSLLGMNQGMGDAYVTKLNRDGSKAWTWQWGTSMEENGGGIAVDPEGNVLVAGYTSGTLQGVNAGGTDAFVMKISSTGTPVWTRQWGTSEYDDLNEIVVDKTGAIYVAGYTEGNLEGANAGNGDAFVTKLNPSGTIAWTRQWGTTKYDDAVSVAIDGDGNIYAGGSTFGKLGTEEAGAGDGYVIRLRADGTVAWTTQWGTFRYDELTAIAINRSGDVVALGNTQGNMAADNAGLTDPFVNVIRQAGGLSWGHQWGTAGEDSGYGLTQDLNGNIFVGGGTTGSFSPSAGGRDAFVTKLTNQGAEAWTHQWGTSTFDNISSLGMDKNGNLFASGSTSGKMGSLDFGGVDIVVTKIGSRNKP